MPIALELVTDSAPKRPRARAARKPASQKRMRLTLKLLMFEDQFGNFVLVDPQRNKPLWLDETRRPPSIYVAATDAEMGHALAEMIDCYSRVARVTSEHATLVAKAERALLEQAETERVAALVERERVARAKALEARA